MTQTTATPSDPVADSRHVWIEGFKSGDTQKIVSIYCDDIILMPPNETSLYGKKEAIEWWQEYFQDFKVIMLSGINSEIRIDGDLVIEEWTYTIAIDPIGGGDRIRDDGRSLIIWNREADGVWRVAKVLWNSYRPIGSGTSRFLSRLKNK